MPDKESNWSSSSTHAFGFFYAWERESDLKYLLIFSCGVFQKDNHCEVVSYQNLEILFKNLPISLVFYQKFGLPWVLNYKKKNAI